MVDAILARHRRTRRLQVLGIANGGIALSQRLAARLHAAGIRCAAGVLDTSFHRDDISINPIPRETALSVIPFDVNDATVILADNVMHSGRTLKAALDELFDHGRPAKVELAVLVDRGGRILPFAPDYVGFSLSAPDDHKVVVHLAPAPSADDAVETTPAIRRRPSSP